MTFVLAVLYYPYNFMLEALTSLIRFDFFNWIVMTKGKKQQLICCQNYLRILKCEKPMPNQNMFDFHFFQLAIYSRFAALLTQMVLDIIFGVIFILLLNTQITGALNVLHWLGQGMELEVLQKQTEWLMGLPGGFKPNPNLAAFIGNAILDLIYIWNYGTTAFIQLQRYFLTNLAFSGVIGSTI